MINSIPFFLLIPLLLVTIISIPLGNAYSFVIQGTMTIVSEDEKDCKEKHKGKKHKNNHCKKDKDHKHKHKKHKGKKK